MVQKYNKILADNHQSHTCVLPYIQETSYNGLHDLQDEEGLSCGERGGENDWGKYVEADGEANEPGRYNGIVGMSSKTCCTTTLDGLEPG